MDDSVTDARPLVLVSNDDGVRFQFLHALAQTLTEHFRVVVVAPSQESSWIGKAISRRKRLGARRYREVPFEAWEVDGTPADAVNIGLGHLLSERPAAVVSGINLGYNTTAPLILSSGTVAAALEGACWGIHAVAASLQLPREQYTRVRGRDGRLEPEDSFRLELAARHTAGMARELVAGEADAPPLVVHNLNFPWEITAETERVRTVPSPWHVGSLFDRGEDGLFQFGPNFLNHPSDVPANWDRRVLGENRISHSILDFSRLGVE